MKHNSLLADFSLQSLMMGVLVAVVGYTGSVVIVLQGLRAAGATDAQAAMGLLAVSVSMGICGIVLSLKTRMPVSVAWSTPGAVLLIASGSVLGSFNEAVGAFLLCGVLLLFAGLYRPLGRLIENIPASLANAMLAGILLVICLAPAKALAADWLLALPVLLTWWLVAQFYRLYSIPAALVVLLCLLAWKIGVPADFGMQIESALAPSILWIKPEFTLSSAISIAFPLFVVTMASQNVPGIAVLRANAYETKAGPLLTGTAVASLLAAPFGSHAVNLAAITAAMCAGEDAHPDKQRRYWASIIAGVVYIVLGVLAGAVTYIMTLIPSVMIEAVAGLALIGAFSGSLVTAFSKPEEREAAAVTFLLSASGMTLAGIGGAFWGLVAGFFMYSFSRWRQRAKLTGSAV